MTKRIVWLATAITIVAIVSLLIPTSLAIQSRNLHAARLELQREASAAALSVLPDEPLSMDSVTAIDNGQHHQTAIYGADGLLIDGDGPELGDSAVVDALTGVFGEASEGGEQIAAVPIPRAGGIHAALRVAERYEDPASESRRQIVRLGVFAACIVVLSGLLGWAVARQLTKPLAQLRMAANAIGRGALTTVVPMTGLGELDDLGQTLASAAARISETVERERSFSNQVSHQLRTPLAAMRVAIETEIAIPRSDPTLVLHDALNAIGRLENTTTGLLALTRGSIKDRIELDLVDVAELARRRWARGYEMARRALVVTAAPSNGFASRTAIDQILDVLLENSLEHGSGTTYLAAGPLDEVESFVSVGDEASIDSKLDPFSVRAGVGHGIGLKLARSLAETERCALRLSSYRPTTFELRLPSGQPNNHASDADDDL